VLFVTFVVSLFVIAKPKKKYLRQKIETHIRALRLRRALNNRRGYVIVALGNEPKIVEAGNF
jgi:hypothetical protein